MTESLYKRLLGVGPVWKSDVSKLRGEFKCVRDTRSRRCVYSADPLHQPDPTCDLKLLATGPKFLQCVTMRYKGGLSKRPERTRRKTADTQTYSAPPSPPSVSLAEKPGALPPPTDMRRVGVTEVGVDDARTRGTRRLSIRRSESFADFRARADAAWGSALDPSLAERLDELSNNPIMWSEFSKFARRAMPARLAEWEDFERIGRAFDRADLARPEKAASAHAPFPVADLAKPSDEPHDVPKRNGENLLRPLPSENLQDFVSRAQHLWGHDTLAGARRNIAVRITDVVGESGQWDAFRGWLRRAAPLSSWVDLLSKWHHFRLES